MHAWWWAHFMCILMAFITTLHLQASADAAMSCKPVQPVTRGGRQAEPFCCDVVYRILECRGRFGLPRCVICPSVFPALHSPFFWTWDPPPIFFVCFFLGYVLLETVIRKRTVTWDLFNVQTSTGACWRDNELQNACALLKFW